MFENFSLYEIQRRKQITERNAFSDTEIDDISFTVGRWNAHITGFFMIAGAAVLMCGWHLLEHLFVHNVRDTSWDATITRIAIIVLISICVLLTVYQLIRPKMHVRGTGFTCRGELCGFSEIDKLHITAGNSVQVYVNGKKLVSYSWYETNAEKLIAWARKCSVRIEDERPARTPAAR